MSLETALADNTAALRELRDLLARVSMPAATVEVPAPKPQARSAAPTAPTSPTAEAAPAVAPETTAPETSAPTYDDVKRAIIDVSKAKNYDGALALLKEFGVTKGPDLKPEQYGAVVARAAELLA
jgi:hypothetical protein